MIHNSEAHMSGGGVIIKEDPDTQIDRQTDSLLCNVRTEKEDNFSWAGN